MSDLISQEQLEDIKKECLLWSHNCGGCETCSQFFGKPPLYDHQETFYLICMIEDRNKRIKDLEMGLLEKIKLRFRTFFANLNITSKKGRKHE